jgi:CHASE3 domain sensor protein
MLDAETGERGYLLTERTEYLEPYRIAVEKIPPTIDALRATITEEYGEKPRNERLASLQKIEQLINGQLASLKISQDFVKQNRDREALYNHLQNGKNLMDAIRADIGEMQTHDGDLLKEKIDEINDIRRRDYIFVFVALLLGLIMRLISFYLFDRGIVRRINRLTENVSSLIKGEPFNNPTPKKEDAIGLLEQEIAKIGEQKNLGYKSEK